MDRTGTAMEISAQLWAMEQYEKNNIPAASRENIENTRVMARHNAVIATLATPGSDGMKKNSLPKGYFVLPETKEILYRDTAKTNKNPKMNFNEISKRIKIWRKENTPIAKEPLEFYAEQTIKKINSAEQPNQIKLAIIEWASLAAQYQENKDRSSSWLHIGRFFAKNSNLSEANLIHGQVTLLIKEVAKLDTSSKDFTQEFVRIKNEISELDKKYSSKKLGTAFNLLTAITAKADEKIQATPAESKTPEPLFIRRTRF